MLKKLIKDESSGQFKSIITDEILPVAKIIHSLPCMDGNALKIYNPEITSWQQERQCAWCGTIFRPSSVSQKLQRFCGRSCSAKWRMNTPEYKKKVHTKEVHARIGKKVSIWLKSDNPTAIKQIERIRALNPMSNPETRAKASVTLRKMKHKPSERGGNGHGMTLPQQIMMDALSGNWIPELAISLGKRKQNFPTCYKVDLGNIDLKIAIEIDGNSHYSRLEKDKKKDLMLVSLGWKVLRFWNKDILNWKDTGMNSASCISMILKQNGIHLSV